MHLYVNLQIPVSSNECEVMVLHRGWTVMILQPLYWQIILKGLILDS